VPYIVGNEACERFSFYGMKAILQVHLTTLFAVQAYIQAAADPEKASKDSATQIVHLFLAGVYAFPMIGALVADRWAGKFRTILYLSLVYCLGHAVLSIGENSLLGMYIGLTLIAIGSGGIKPCVSANVGDQFGKKNLFRIQTIFQIFYFSINFGSFFATLLIPFLRLNAGRILIDLFPTALEGADPRRLGTSVAFALPGILMFLATFVFWLGRRKFVHAPPQPGGQLGLLDTFCSVSLFLTLGHLFATPMIIAPLVGDNVVLKWVILVAISVAFLVLGLYLFTVRQKLKPDDGFLAITFHVVATHLGLRPKAPNATSGFWAPGYERFGPATDGPIAVFKIISIFFLVSVFWALFDQHSSTWIVQAEKMDLWLWGEGRDSLIGIPNIKFDASQTSTMNPLFVMLLIPLLNLIYAGVDRMGVKTTPLRRVTFGMFLTALSFVATALLQMYIEGQPKNSVWIGWQAVQYLIITFAEVMVSVTGLEFAYTQAPKRMKSTVMGFWLLTVTLGNVLVAFLVGLKGLTVVNFFWVCAGMSAGAAVLFALRAMFYTPRDFTQE